MCLIIHTFDGILWIYYIYTSFPYGSGDHGDTFVSTWRRLSTVSSVVPFEKVAVHESA